MVAPTTVKPRAAPNVAGTSRRHRLVRLVADPEDCPATLSERNGDRIEERVERLLNDLRNDDIAMALLDLAQLHRAVAGNRAFATGQRPLSSREPLAIGGRRSTVD